MTQQKFPADHSIIRPGRYIGREWNLPPARKETVLSVVLVYPDLYEIGMSHFGLQVLNHILQTQSEVQVDRAFPPWPDYETYLRNRHLQPLSLQYRKPLSEFDVLFITLPHELSYTNILNLLDLSGIPIISEERTDRHPLVVGGGICSLNPLPLERFFDVFLIGDGDEAILEVLQAMKAGSCSKPPHQVILQRLAVKPGFYVPSVHRHQIEKNPSSFRIKKRILPDLKDASHPSPPLVPICKPTHERVVVEATRGCPRKCRFCQAQVYYGPVRRRSKEQIARLIKKNLAQTGYDEVSLLSLNITDYPGIESLLDELMASLAPHFVSVSLPSLRPEKLSPAMINQIKKVRKSGFTLAPEAGSDCLRQIINKPYDTNRLLSSVASIFQAGWSVIKLYFMIGLPFETDEDVFCLIDLVRDIRRIGFKIRGKKSEIHLSISTFIPKPHTPFQWAGQVDDTTLKSRMQMIRKSLSGPGIKMSIHDPFSSRIEALFSLGDRNIGNSLLHAFKRGCRFDAWREWMNPDQWLYALADSGVDLKKSVTECKPLDGTLPWSFIDAGHSTDQLLKSYQIAENQSKTTPIIQTTTAFDFNELKRSSSNTPTVHSSAQEKTWKYTGFYSVCEEYRLFSHREIIAEIIRAARRTDMKIEFSHGFNPRARFSFSQPPPFGFERYREPVEFILKKKLDTDTIERLFNRQLPGELSFKQVWSLNGDGIQMKELPYAVYAFRVDPDQIKDDLRERLCLLSESAIYEFCPDLESVIRRREFNLFFSLNQQKPSGLNLKELIRICFQKEELPLHKPLAARLFFMQNERIR